MKQSKNTCVFNENGFTLVELMIVVIVIGILAAVAMPHFIRAADKTRAAEAPLMLSAISGGQEAHRLVRGTYLPLDTDGGAGPRQNWDILGVRFPEIRYFDYIVDNITDGNLGVDLDDPLDDVAPTFIARARLIRRMSRAAIGEEITINHLGNKGASPALRILIPSYFEGQP